MIPWIYLGCRKHRPLGNGDYEIQIDDEKHIEYIVDLVKQVYEKNKV